MLSSYVIYLNIFLYVSQNIICVPKMQNGYGAIIFFFVSSILLLDKLLILIFSLHFLYNCFCFFASFLFPQQFLFQLLQQLLLFLTLKDNSDQFSYTFAIVFNSNTNTKNEVKAIAILENKHFKCEPRINLYFEAQIIFWPIVLTFACLQYNNLLLGSYRNLCRGGQLKCREIVFLQTLLTTSLLCS